MIFILLLLALLPAGCIICFRGKPVQLLTIFSQIVFLSIFLLSLVLPLLVSLSPHLQWQINVLPALHLVLEIHYSALTWVMLCLVSFVSLMAQSYAARYMQSDLNQSRFMMQLSLLTFSVMFLMMSASLLTAFIAWQLIGLSLYLLLNHYHYDRRANKAAKKKFIINRVGDLCFLLAVLLAFQHYGTTAFSVLFEHRSHFDVVILVLVFVAIMTKSAQFPFHIWLIDTMEAPTPVSALMHAGVINAGGFLLASLSPLYQAAPIVMLLVFIIGIITALMGNFFMINQPDTKKKLAYSTMGQMGYMVTQCGLGCFSSALFHLIAHGFFKATLFLSAGSNLLPSLPQNRMASSSKPKHYLKSAALSFVWAVLLVAVGYRVLQYTGHFMNPLLWFFIGISLFQLSQKIMHQSQTMAVSCLMQVMMVCVYALYLVALTMLDLILHSAIDHNSVVFNLLGWSVATCIAIVIVLYSVFNYYGPRRVKQAFMTRLYLLGFYKGNIEYYYRRFGLNPLRQLGDCLIQYTQSLPSLVRIMSGVSGIIISVITALWLMWKVPQNNLPTHEHGVVLILSVFIFVTTLIVANRTKDFGNTLKILFFSMLVLSITAMAIGVQKWVLIGMFQLINSLLVMSVLGILLRQRQRASSQTYGHDNLIHNRLPWSHFYMSVLLMLLIGIPGTASFISEFYLLGALLHNHIILTALTSIGMLLLTLVVLHLLQVKIFNPKAIQHYAAPISPMMHGACVLAIGFNIYSGLFPSTLLHLIALALGH